MSGRNRTGPQPMAPARCSKSQREMPETSNAFRCVSRHKQWAFDASHMNSPRGPYKERGGHLQTCGNSSKYRDRNIARCCCGGSHNCCKAALGPEIRPKFDQDQPVWANWLLILAKFGQNWPGFGNVRPNMGSQFIVEIEQFWSNHIGECLVNLARIWPAPAKFGR